MYSRAQFVLAVVAVSALLVAFFLGIGKIESSKWLACDHLLEILVPSPMRRDCAPCPTKQMDIVIPAPSCPPVIDRETLYHHSVLPMFAPPVSVRKVLPSSWLDASKDLATRMTARLEAGPLPPPELPKRQVRCLAVDYDSQVRAAAAMAVDGVVAFTIADGAYVDMMDDFALMMDRVGYGSNFFVGCLDRETYEKVCNAGYFGITSLYHDDPLKANIAQLKFGLTRRLMELGVSVLFLEMDVFLRTSPKFIFDAEKEVELIHICHQDNPWSINIGFWLARPSPRNIGLFDAMLAQAGQDPSLWDQGIVNCFVKRGEFGNLQETSNCDDYSLSHTAPSVPYYVIEPQVFISHRVPLVFEETVGVHVLTTVPLHDATGKKMLAKELFLWEGAQGYYDIGARRYLAYDSVVTTAFFDSYHDLPSMDNRLLLLIAIAYTSNRILVLPTQVHLNRPYHAWFRVNPTRLASFVEFREASFFRNPKVDLAGIQSITRLTLQRDAIGIADVPNFGQKQHTEWYQATGTDVEKDLWGILDSHSSVRDCNLLLVREDFITLHWDINIFPQEHQAWLSSLKDSLKFCAGDKNQEHCDATCMCQ